jgi:hypothetical protein
VGVGVEVHWSVQCSVSVRPSATPTAQTSLPFPPTA